MIKEHPEIVHTQRKKMTLSENVMLNVKYQLKTPEKRSFKTKPAPCERSASLVKRDGKSVLSSERILTTMLTSTLTLATY